MSGNDEEPGTPATKKEEMTPEEKLLAELMDKRDRSLENLKKITEAESVWVTRHKELLQRFKQRMSSQGDMESFISDQIIGKLEVVAQLEAKIAEKKEHLSKLKQSNQKKVAQKHADHKRTVRVLQEEKRMLEDKWDDEKHTRAGRDKMSVEFVILQRRLKEEKVKFSAAIQEFESASTRDIDRLIRKEMIRNQGAKGAYKEQLLAEKRKRGTKATHEYVANFDRIKRTGADTMAVLASNERLMKQQHDLKHELDVQNLAAERAKRCNEELERYLQLIVEQYFEKSQQIGTAKARSNTKISDKDMQLRELKRTVSESKKEAEALRTELRQVLEDSEQIKRDTRDSRQQAHDMFQGDSVAWAITAALPAIRAQTDDDNLASRMTETDAERNENDLELLLSALHLSSRRGQSGDNSTPRGALRTRGSQPAAW